jgi:group I intron endonuclease
MENVVQKKYILYTIQNIKSSGIYFGQTSTLMRIRSKSHFQTLKRNQHHNPHLQKSYNKHGKQAFRIEPLEEYYSRKECDEAERFYIGYYRFLGSNIYNIESGGEAWTSHSEETKRKLSIANIGKKMSPESIAKTIKGRKERGFWHSDETIKKISASKQGKPISEDHKIAICHGLKEMYSTPRGKEVIVKRIATLHKNGGLSPEAKKKMSDLLIARNKSPEHILKCSIARIGRVTPISVRQKISKSLLGRKYPKTEKK